MDCGFTVLPRVEVPTKYSMTENLLTGNKIKQIRLILKCKAKTIFDWSNLYILGKHFLKDHITTTTKVPTGRP